MNDRRILVGNRSFLSSGRQILIIAALSVYLIMGANDALATRLSESQRENLVALAKTYGLVRYFHPSDEASCVDWDLFLQHSIASVLSQDETGELGGVLKNLFSPLTQGVSFHSELGQEKASFDAELDGDKDHLFWQHLGLESAISPPPYRSTRVGSVLTHSNRPAVVVQTISILDREVEEVRLSGKVHVASSRDRCSMYSTSGLILQGAAASGELLFHETIDSRLGIGQWETLEITHNISPDVSTLTVGGSFRGANSAWLDALRLEYKTKDGTWREIALENSDFESKESWLSGKDWRQVENGYIIGLSSDFSSEGSNSVYFRAAAPERLAPIFDVRPPIGAQIQTRIAPNLAITVPTSLPASFSKDKWIDGELPSQVALKRLLDYLGAIETTFPERVAAIAAVIQTWNIYAFFYPYWDVVDTDWDAQLEVHIDLAASAITIEDTWWTLKSLTASSQDGHAQVYHEEIGNMRSLPFEMDYLEESIVVIRDSKQLQHGKPCIQAGDVILEIEGKSAEEVLTDLLAYEGGSSHYRVHRVLRRLLGSGNEGTTIAVKKKDDTGVSECEVRRGSPPSSAPDRRSLVQVADDVWYVDLSMINDTAFIEEMPELHSAGKIVFDLRRNSRVAHSFLGYLALEDLHLSGFKTPMIILPPSDSAPDYVAGEIRIESKLPHIGDADIYFLADHSTLSASETILQFVKEFGLGTIVGRTTAGVNGNISRARLAGGFVLVWTGMRVERQDGSPIHLRGVEPDLEIEYNIEHVRANRDPWLEAFID